MNQTTDRPLWKRPGVFLPVGLLVVAAFAIAMYLFQPWALFTNVEVDEALPETTELTDTNSASDGGTAGAGTAGQGQGEVGSGESGAAGSGDGTSTTDSPATQAPARTNLATGSFVSQAHPTEGSAKVIQLADGRRVLRLEGFQTDNGPDLKVWLSSKSANNADEARDGQWINLGELKGNIGNQNYWLEDDVDLSDYKSVLIWCDRFSVSFGAADLKPV